MSLSRRIWLAIIGLTLAAFLGSLLVNTLTARSYLEKQLFLKNSDNATALALSMSQITEKDPVTIELLLSAQFDTGHYQEIVLTDPKGNVIVERRQESDQDLGAPSWFVNLLPIKADPGIAHIQDGWKQFGSISLASHSKFAYRDLWQGTLDLSGYFLIGGLLAGLLGTILVRLITRPLNAVVEQAHAITERRFITVETPKIPELSSVVGAMNDMVLRVKQMFADEAARLDAMRKQLAYDAVSNLPNRDHFMGRLREALENDDAPSHGTLLFLRLVDLAEINRNLGHVGTDKLLREVGLVLKDICGDKDRWLPARVKGPDFAILAQGEDDAQELAKQVAEHLSKRQGEHWPQLTNLFHIGAVCYQRGDNMGAALSTADQALAQAESQGPNAWVTKGEEATRAAIVPAETWREIIADAIGRGRIKLVHFPVIDSKGEALHREGLIRMQTEADGPWHPAGDFMPMAVRLNLTSSLDLGVIRLALEELRGQEGSIAINLTAETISDWEFRNKLADLLKGHANLCPRLWMEVPEYGTFSHFDAFRDLSHTLKQLGCKVGIEHFGRKLSEVDKLADLGVDYVKVDTSFISDIDSNPGNQEFLKGLCRMAHNLGILVIAVGVQTEGELAVLPGLGFDGATGPAVKV
jgi:diguanylate cyclase (GGDEF)-like protein